MKKILGRILLVVPAIALQVFWYVLLFGGLDTVVGGHLGNVIQILFTVLAVIFVLVLISRRDESSYKILWIVVILGFPILGAILYAFLGNKSTGRSLKRKMEKAPNKVTVQEFVDEKDLSDELKKEDRRLGQSVKRIYETTGFPLLKNDTSKYYPFGEDMFADMCEDLKKAEKYIFIEYFIIQRGVFWDTLTDILADRAAAGVDVRVMYDDLGSIATYSLVDIRDLQQKGIKCIPFNPLFFVTTQLNNRDHRKIMVIDGRVAYSGGVNLADEYVNEKELFGKWKDIGFRITGAGVKSYTFMFVEFWNSFSKDLINKEEIGSFDASDSVKDDNGFILPYYDSPMREEHTSNVFYTEVLSLATEYVWFYTPYLMLGDALFDAFIRAAERGIDVRIIMPGIPDKKAVYRLSRSYYRDLLKAGVKIYEYTPGFVHAKAMIADGKVATIGTVNLDYRSLFLHFECNSLFYKADIIESLKKDYETSLESCTQRTLENINNGIFYRFIDCCLRVLAPLL
ncbi:cardiolipin synthase [Butyrivibrio sp. AE3006]|uniref:cardiolipin synthase n=1 Tax=Butyrivibrio sp. AE3006 TaxID=1280673 RepID=UPI0003FFFB50|nr:cardiolipin synthase [Butyrivibrio sp. AE3006]